jgi:hypothetical protein
MTRQARCAHVPRQPHVHGSFWGLNIVVRNSSFGRNLVQNAIFGRYK